MITLKKNSRAIVKFSFSRLRYENAKIPQRKRNGKNTFGRESKRPRLLLDFFCCYCYYCYFSFCRNCSQRGTHSLHVKLQRSLAILHAYITLCNMHEYVNVSISRSLTLHDKIVTENIYDYCSIDFNTKYIATVARELI